MRRRQRGTKAALKPGNVQSVKEKTEKDAIVVFRQKNVFHQGKGYRMRNKSMPPLTK